MKRVDLTFEESKLNIAKDLHKLKELDDVRRKLNEQLFLLDLQQEVSIKRYKRYLQMIGEHQQRENHRYFNSQNQDSKSLRSFEIFLTLTKEDIISIKDQKVPYDKINEIKTNLDQYKTSICKIKENYFNLSKQDAIFRNILNKISNKIKDDKAEENISLNSNKEKISLELVMEKLNEQQIKKIKFQKLNEGLIKEITLLLKIEEGMQNQLLYLQKQATLLVKKRKWHQNLKNSSEEIKEANYMIENNSLSIP